MSIVRSGYVGATVAACFADYGHDVVNVDVDESAVGRVNAGESLIGEPGVKYLLANHAGDRITATTDYDQVTETDVTLLALPTPSNDDGSIDTSYVKTAAASVGDVLGNTPSHDEHVVATKSTVIPGTTDEEVAPTLRERAPETATHVAANPEFLRIGSAVDDSRNPDKIVLGGDEVAVERLTNLYRPVRTAMDAPAHPVTTGLREAEMVKYANNAFFRSKVSLINDIGNICNEFDIDAYEFAEAVGLATVSPAR